MSGRRIIGFALVVSVSAVESHAANPAPVYLTCNITTSEAGSSGIINFTVDEVNQTVTSVNPANGHTQRFKAVFAPETVTMQASAPTFSMGYVLGRVTLRIGRALVIGKKKWLDQGTCSVVPAPKRAF